MSNKIVERARERREKRKKRMEDRRSGQSNFSFVDVQKLALKKNKTASEQVFRIVGAPYEGREKPTDSKLIFFSRILNDDKSGYSNIIWKTVLNAEDGLPEVNKDWILYKLWKKVTEYDWREFSEEEKASRGDNQTGEKIFKHAHTKTFQRINSNKADWDQFPPDFKFKQRVLMQVIDRKDSWCSENKHTKILFSKVDSWVPKDSTDNKEIEMAREYGVPSMFYELIWEDIVRHSTWEEDGIPIDIIAYATGKLPVAYKVYDAEDTKKISEESMKVASADSLTDEEKAYEMYDLDAIYKETSYRKLKDTFSGLFKQFDVDFNQNFFEELCVLADKEVKENEEEKNDEAATDINEKVEDKKEEVRVERSKKEEVKEEDPPWDTTSVEDFLKNLPQWDRLTDEDKKDMLDKTENISNGVINYFSDVNTVQCDNEKCLFPETDKETILPSTVLICPVCGMVFDA